MRQVLWVHTVDATSNIFFRYLSFLNQGFNQDTARDTVIRIVRDVPTFARNKYFVTLDIVLADESRKGSTDSSLCLLTPVIYRSVEEIDRSTAQHVFDSIVLIEVIFIIWFSHISAQTHCAQVKLNFRLVKRR
jgi:hypothetical protein